MRVILCFLSSLALLGCNANSSGPSSFLANDGSCTWRWDGHGNKVCDDDGTAPLGARGMSYRAAVGSNAAPSCARWSTDSYGNRFCDDYGTTSFDTGPGNYASGYGAPSSGAEMARPSSASSGSGGANLSDAVQVLGGAASLAGGLASLRSSGGLGGYGGGGMGNYAGGGLGNVSRGASTPSLPATNGYSQVGAFKDCELMFRAAGDADGAAKCASRATDMSSMPGMRILH
jgi:hypothetical protein